MIEEAASAADVEAFWSDGQDGGGKTFTLPAGGANDTGVIPSATDDQSGSDALPALVAALAKVTAERDRARDLAALLEARLARVQRMHRPVDVPAVYSFEGFTRCSCTRGLEYARCATAAVLDDALAEDGTIPLHRSGTLPTICGTCDGQGCWDCTDIVGGA